MEAEAFLTFALLFPQHSGWQGSPTAPTPVSTHLCKWLPKLDTLKSPLIHYFAHWCGKLPTKAAQAGEGLLGLTVRGCGPSRWGWHDGGTPRQLATVHLPPGSWER